MTSNRSKLLSVWTADIRHPKAKEDFQKYIINALGQDPLPKRLRQILQKMKDECEVVPPDDASWPYRRAYADGMIVAYNRILKLLETPNE